MTTFPDFHHLTVEFLRADGSGVITVPLRQISSWERDADDFGSIVWLVDGKTRLHVTMPYKKVKALFKH